AMTYQGSTLINKGILAVANANAFSATGGTVIANTGGLLGLSAGTTLPPSQPITLNGGGIDNVSGNNTLAGSVKLTKHSSIQSDAGILTVAGHIDLNSFTLNGTRS